MSYDVRIQSESLDPWQVLATLERDLPRGKHGATVSFVGTMRDFNDDATVRIIELEHYPGMTERQLEYLCGVAMERWDASHIVIRHRIGRLNPGDAIVLVAVWSQHRAAAFDACRYLIGELKKNAPFWKKEHRETDARWVSENTPD